MNERENTGRWHRLDNTANLFPVITSRRFTNVYRLAVLLGETVRTDLLQRAVEETLPRFDALRVRLRHGLFWSYLENNNATPRVKPEDDYPCRYIDPKQNENFLFRVSCFKNRINLEVFHVLTDGSGAQRFLMAIACRYLTLAHPGDFTEEERGRSWFAQHAGETEDSYVANYTKTKKADFRVGRAVRLRGERARVSQLSVIHAHIGVGGLKELCKQRGTGLTQYLTACIGWAIYEEQLKCKAAGRPVNIFLPVNLRNMFDSNTALNFFSNIYVTLYFGEGTTFESVLEEVEKQFEEKITREQMLEKISYTVGSGYSPFVRVVPLPLKNLGLRLIYETSAGSSSLSFSNLGRLDIPEPFQKYITGAAVLLSCSPREPFKCSAVSVGDTLTLTMTSTLRSVALQRNIVRHLAADRADVVVETNGVDYESL